MEKQSDRELLELAAKAAGLEVSRIHQEQRDLSLGSEKASLWIKGGSTALFIYAGYLIGCGIRDQENK